MHYTDGAQTMSEHLAETPEIIPQFIIIDQFAYDMKIEFEPCKKHGTRIHLDGECVGCMEDRFGPLTDC
jgi:hypothetical protein